MVSSEMTTKWVESQQTEGIPIWWFVTQIVNPRINNPNVDASIWLRKDGMVVDSNERCRSPKVATCAHENVTTLEGDCLNRTTTAVTASNATWKREKSGKKGTEGQRMAIDQQQGFVGHGSLASSRNKRSSNPNCSTQVLEASGQLQAGNSPC